MIAQLIQDLVHLEGGQDGFDQDGGANGAPRDAQLILSQVEDVVPQARLEVALELGQVEIRSAALFEQPLGVMKEVEAKIEEAARHRLAVNLDMSLVQVPATRPDEKGRNLIVQPVLLAFGTGEVDAPFDGVDQVDLALDEV